MPSTKEIRAKIKSVQNTRKITKAMEMVAASKMRKAQDRMLAARPYGERIRNIVARLASASTSFEHPYLRSVGNDAAKIGLIMVTTDKGLAGPLNTNIQRAVWNKIKDWKANGAEVTATAIGNKGLGFLQRSGVEVLSQVIQLGDRPNMERLIGAIDAQLELYTQGKLDKVYLAYSRFLNAMKQEPVVEQLLPLSADRLEEIGEGSREHSWDYLYEPDDATVLGVLLKRYVEALIYQAVAENMASEQSARMVAMKAASDNAHKLIGDLQLVYNKTRQAAITTEITEIVGGAAAVS
ncbi:MAG: F0F1 ATP synthase subunit gamma [Burkholderiaceae bacterium]|jgi:F-type H+-transporting ATPase subunit gamma|nr:F0F1 ATP synthase subunit gamma [Burkholderiaceae bacterium]